MLTGSVPETGARPKATCFVALAVFQSIITEGHLNEHLTSSQFSPFLLPRIPRLVETSSASNKSSFYEHA